jgi:hypothetical protein
MMVSVVSSGQVEVSETVRQAVMQACRLAFHWKSDVRDIFISAGVHAERWDRHDHGETSYKVKIVRLVLSDLRDMRTPAARQLERKIVEELCRWDRPHKDAPDQAAGKSALAELQRVAQAEQLLVNPERVAAQARRDRAEQEQRKRERRAQQVAGVRAKFYELSRDRDRTPAEIQRRGYELELLLAELFEAAEMQYKRPYKAAHEQIDGSFNFRSFTYLVEAKWKKNAPSFGDLAEFKAKVDGKLESVRGLFVAMAGYDPAVMDHFFKVTRNSRNNIVLMDRDDLLYILEGRMPLEDALTAKVNAAEQQGQWWYPLGR